jgi:hypothetical protein
MSKCECLEWGVSGSLNTRCTSIRSPIGNSQLASYSRQAVCEDVRSVAPHPPPGRPDIKLMLKLHSDDGSPSTTMQVGG